MLTMLKELEYRLSIIGYYRAFINHFIAIAELLVKLKAIRFRYAPIKGAARDN